ncbi:MAG: hypothetical protein PVH85_17000 [Desulfobacterales bacterium]
MGEPNDADNLNSGLDNRLDDLFAENDTPLLDKETGNASEHYPLSELKNLIFSLDWEITDEVLEKLLQQIKDLNMTYDHDKIVLTFLQILNAVGVYIKTNRAKAHPSSFKTLNTVFSSLDKVVLSKNMSDSDKRKILSTEMNRYKKLRTLVAQSKAEKERHKMMRQEAGGAVPESFFQIPNAAEGKLPDTELQPDVFAEALNKAVEEIKQHIQTEINALKAELKSLL